MLNKPGIRLLVIAALALASAWILVDRKVQFGLDLRGGTQLMLEVRDDLGVIAPEQRADAIDRALTVIRTRIDALGVREAAIQKSGRERILVELPGTGSEDQRRAREVLERTAFLQFQIVRPMEVLTSALPRLDRAIATIEPETPGGPRQAGGSAVPRPLLPSLIEDPVDPPADSPSGSNVSTTPRLPAAGTPGVVNRPLSEMITPAGIGGGAVVLVAEADVPVVDRYLEHPAVRQALPSGVVPRWGVPERAIAPGYRTLYLLDADELITGEYLVDAQAQRDPQRGQPVVVFEFSRQGGRIFEQGTRANVGKLMAIALDDQVMSAATIIEPIAARGRIDLGGGTLEAARDLALVLRAGALPAPLRVVDQRSIGPSLGQDSIDRGQVAGIIGLSVLALILVAYYRLAGALALAALALYVLFVLAGLAIVGAALTLPGIAGLVLSIGMAVDANVLIFERIREEAAEARSFRAAVNDGFAKALSAIVDAQITTLLTAAVLYQLGTGPVRGFAVTLGIGIVASVFTGIFVTRTFLTLWIDRVGTWGTRQFMDSG